MATLDNVGACCWASPAVALKHTRMVAKTLVIVLMLLMDGSPYCLL
jgi:hypothetical protein